MKNRIERWAETAPALVPQTSKSAVSRVSKPASRPNYRARSTSSRAADLEIGDTAGLETCATKVVRGRAPARWGVAVLLCLVCVLAAQEKRPPTAAVEGIKGIKEDAISKIKNPETGNATPSGGVTAGTKNTAQGVKEDAVAKIKNPETGNATPTGGVPTGTQNTAQGVNKIDGIDTINGVKADGRTAVLPPPPPPPPPPAAPPIVPIKGTAVNVGGGTVGASGSIRSITGVAGINTVKLQNLEAALQLKHADGKPEPGGKAAAAALLGPGPAGPKPGPKADGRVIFQEFEKLPDKGS